MLRAVTCIDLTTLSGDDTATNVSRLCFKAKSPVREDLIKALGMQDAGTYTYSLLFVSIDKVFPDFFGKCEYSTMY